jgi:integral membrane protein (TIGR01906 family)
MQSLSSSVQRGKDMKIITGIVYVLLICCIPVLLITGTIKAEVGNIRLYESGFNKYNISEDTGIDKTGLHNVARHLIDYFNLKTDSAQISVMRSGKQVDLFNSKELIHLQDVRDLIQMDYLVFRIAVILIIMFALILFFLSSERLRKAIKGLFWGSVVTLTGVIVLVLWTMFGFERFFVLFHIVSFSNDLWILDPATDYLIRLFPEGFFYDAALYGFIAIIVEAFLLGIITFILFKRIRYGYLAAKPGGLSGS